VSLSKQQQQQQQLAAHQAGRGHVTGLRVAAKHKIWIWVWIGTGGCDEVVYSE
jgi:hypothetical protein